MPTDLVQAVQQLGPIVEKLGVVGLLLAVVGWLIHERLRLMKELRAAYRDRDRGRFKAERYRNALVAADQQVPDTADIDLQFQAETG